MCAVRVERTFSASTSGEGIYDDLLDTARVHLEVQFAVDGVLPELSTHGQVQNLVNTFCRRYQKHLR